MTLLEVAKHALEAMEDAMYRADTHEFYDAKESLRYAIEQAEQAEQEPVAWAVYDILHGGSKTLHWPEQHSPNGDPKQYKAVPLYTAPTPRKPLTDEALHQVIRAGNYDSMEQFARAIERAHGIGEQHE